MRTIFKYNINLDDTTTIVLPLGSEILSARAQLRGFYVWAYVDTEELARTTRRIKVYGTGHEMSDEPHKFIDTILVQGGTFVFHVFEVFPEDSN